MRNLKLLLVDDEEEFASALAERLRLRGIDVLAVFKGEDALRRVEDDPPDMVLLDVWMPGLGGMELLKILRQRHPGIPVILLTGQGGADEGIGSGAGETTEFLMKPIDINDLMAKIRNTLRPG